jgi:hypothetical protein
MNKAQANYYMKKKAPLICKPFLDSVNIHTLINSKVPKEKRTLEKEKMKASNTLNLIKIRLKLGYTARQAINQDMNSTPSDRRREARAKKWIKRLNREAKTQ